MDTRESILQIIRGKGPVIPVQISKEIGLNILMASAHLSELVSNKQLKISHVKVGGTPLYYLPGQEAMLQRFSDNLHEKEKNAYNLLHQHKVLQDSQLEPVVRVALRNIKDYAVPLQVTVTDSSEIFWRWYLTDNKQAEELIKELLKLKEPKPELKPETVVKPEPPVEKKETSPEPVQETEPVNKEEPQKQLEPKKEEKPIAKPKAQKKEEIKSDFIEKITNYFNKNKITILSKEPLKKSEVDLIIQIPTPVGNMEYYCKAKDKQKINDGDLASAYVQGQTRKLPVLLVTNGDLTKRAQDMLQKEFKGMSIKKI